MRFSRGLFGRPPNPSHIEKVLKELSLWDKKDSRIMTLSGGMKRRVLIAKALAHEPQILFLDEPTAGVDVELRKDMWQLVRELRASGVTIILTTHYIEEAEEMADRIGVINKGALILVDEKSALMKKLALVVAAGNRIRACFDEFDLGFDLANAARNLVIDGLHKGGLVVHFAFDRIAFGNVVHNDSPSSVVILRCPPQAGLEG